MYVNNYVFVFSLLVNLGQGFVLTWTLGRLARELNKIQILKKSKSSTHYALYIIKYDVYIC